MNQRPQRAFIGAEGVNFIEAVEPQSAQRALPGLIQRMPVYKRSAAGPAVKLGGEPLRLVQAAGTDRDTGDFVEGLFANAAVIRENQIEKTAHYPFGGVVDAAGHYKSTSGTGEQATGEDPPPPKTPVYTRDWHGRISEARLTGISS